MYTGALVLINIVLNCAVGFGIRRTIPVITFLFLFQPRRCFFFSFLIMELQSFRGAEERFERKEEREERKVWRVLVEEESHGRNHETMNEVRGVNELKS